MEEGFDRAGVARLDPSEHGEVFRSWIARGDHAGMEYLARRVDERLEPASRLEGARSAVCVALHYGDRGGDESDLWRGVARYAVGDDYHDVLMAGLRRLGDRIEAAFPGCRTRSYVDHGPLLERELAQRAGIGRIGKNTMLLHRTGSWFLLGEVLTTLDLEPGEALPDLCGNCTRCLDACPTGALPEAFRLDARRCISYWTIEHRGDLPASAPDPEGWVFGCDICQEVCPWNGERNPRRRGCADGRLAPREVRRGLRLVDLVGLERKPYTELFRRSPLKRPKLGGLQRNAAVVLASEARRLLAADAEPATERLVEIVEALLRGLRSDEGTGRRAAARALVTILTAWRSAGPAHPSVAAWREEVAAVLEREEEPVDVDLLRGALEALGDPGAEGRG